MRISFEIVPRTRDAMMEQLAFVENKLPFIDTINIPDLLRFPIRSWDAATDINADKFDFIPHIRVIDFDLKDDRLQKIIEKYELKKVLLVSGDPPPDMSFPIFNTSVIDMISTIRKSFPSIEILAGFDPYRSSIKDEKEYINRKFDAGVDYVLSQPFFDMRLLEIYSDFIPADKVFWGISPVITEKSKNYWERMNHAIFPADYVPSYEWNIEFAKKVLAFSEAKGSHVYFMPIRIDLEKYFLPLLK